MHSASKQDGRSFSGLLIIAYVVVISVAVDAAFVLSQVAHLGSIGTVAVIGTAGLLTGAILFTVIEMCRLDRTSR